MMKVTTNAQWKFICPILADSSRTADCYSVSQHSSKPPPVCVFINMRFRLCGWSGDTRHASFGNTNKGLGGNGSAGGTLGGTEGVVKYGLNSGFTSGVKGTGALAEVVKIDKSL